MAVAAKGKPAEKPAVVHRYAPGFKPGMIYGPKARQEQAKAEVDGDQPISAADAMKMMGAGKKQKVVITDLDRRKPGTRREVVTRSELFSDRRFRQSAKKKRLSGNKKSKKTEITTPAQHKRIIRMKDTVAVGDIAADGHQIK